MNDLEKNLTICYSIISCVLALIMMIKCMLISIKNGYHFDNFIALIILAIIILIATFIGSIGMICFIDVFSSEMFEDDFITHQLFNNIFNFYMIYLIIKK